MNLEEFITAVERLLTTVQHLSLARDLETIMSIVRKEARALTGADGATFILREGDCCYYAEEDAIAPLWKGKKFPLNQCISGWVMLNRQSTVIEDIYVDPRIPVDAYRPTFVKSLVMVPIRTESPIGAIGNYWAKPHRASPEEIKLLQALADSTSIAMENVKLYSELEQRVKDRTEQLETINKELESFSYSVSHDLRAPLHVIQGFSEALMADKGHLLDEQSKDYLQRICNSTHRMSDLIEDMLKLARISSYEMHPQPVNLSDLAKSIVNDIIQTDPHRKTNIQIEDNIIANGDPRLLRIMLENLLNNAWKFSGKKLETVIQFGYSKSDKDAKPVYFLRDQGAGFDMNYADKLFGAFRRLHRADEFPGTGIGLATVARIVNRHGGKIWAESVVNQGTTFYFEL
jgi:signal transduction histidine kinase